MLPKSLETSQFLSIKFAMQTLHHLKFQIPTAWGFKNIKSSETLKYLSVEIW